MNQTALFIVGPTGSGKSELALALARKIKGEIVSCDAMQVYLGMDIGTAKPERKIRTLISHHLIDLITPRSEYSVFEFRNLALEAMNEIFSRSRVPIFVGGSGLYLKALIDGLAPQPGRHLLFRRKLEQLAQKKGLMVLYARLKKIDPKRARRIHPHDRRRIIRALEIFEFSKRTPSEWNSETKGLEEQGIRFLMFGILRDREELYERIEQRVDRMFEAGWIEEVKRLKSKGLSQTARAAIGYFEILEYLQGKLDLNEVKGQIKKRTRHLAKKQIIWFRKDPRIHWISVSGERFVPKALRQAMSYVCSYGDTLLNSELSKVSP